MKKLWTVFGLRFPVLQWFQNIIWYFRLCISFLSKIILKNVKTFVRNPGLMVLSGTRLQLIWHYFYTFRDSEYSFRLAMKDCLSFFIVLQLKIILWFLMTEKISVFVMPPHRSLTMMKSCEGSKIWLNFIFAFKKTHVFLAIKLLNIM